jgi:hypothetical protein
MSEMARLQIGETISPTDSESEADPPTFHQPRYIGTDWYLHSILGTDWYIMYTASCVLIGL